MFTFSILDYFFASFVQKSIWHFDVTWLISQQFSRRDLKPVTFLVSIHLMSITLYKDLKFFKKLNIIKSFAFSFLPSLHGGLACLLSTPLPHTIL